MNKKVLKIAIIIGVLIAILTPLLNRYYLYPIKWKKAFHDTAVLKYKNSSEERISALTDCVFDYFSKKYGAINIPEEVQTKIS